MKQLFMYLLKDKSKFKSMMRILQNIKLRTLRIILIKIEIYLKITKNKKKFSKKITRKFLKKFRIF